MPKRKTELNQEKWGSSRRSEDCGAQSGSACPSSQTCLPTFPALWALFLPLVCHLSSFVHFSSVPPFSHLFSLIIHPFGLLPTTCCYVTLIGHFLSAISESPHLHC